LIFTLRKGYDACAGRERHSAFGGKQENTMVYESPAIEARESIEGMLWHNGPPGNHGGS
jgi:hypothetical protein